MRSFTQIVLIAVIVATQSTCTKRAERTLVGSYHLVHPEGCQVDIQDSTLTIRDDGTFNQRVQFKSGKIETIEDGNWTYAEMDRRINFSKFLFTAQTSFTADAHHPAVILVNRPEGCWYQHPK
jgi:hypothetical protein